MSKLFAPARASVWDSVRNRVKKTSRTKKIVVSIIILGAAGLLAYRMFFVKKEGPAFTEHAVAREDLSINVSAPGEVTPQNRIELKPPLSGRIDKILVREGDFVTKGQILAWLSSSERAALLDAARASGPEEMTRWEDAYKPTPLVAPLDGFIIARTAEPGQTLSSGQAPLVMADRLIVRAQVDETDMGKIRIGQPAKVLLDAYPELDLPGRVDHLAYEATEANNVTVYDIEVEILEPSRVLRAGMTATVNVTIADRRKVLTVPMQALSDFDGGLAVMVKGENGQPKPLPISAGLSDGTMVEILDGLKEGSVILVSTKTVPMLNLSEYTSPLTPNFGRRTTATTRKATPARRAPPSR